MQLLGIQTKNYLSLRDCTIVDLDPRLNFVIGPNGSGKTNIFRLLRTVRDVFNTAALGRRSSLGQLCSQGLFPQEVDVSIKVKFDTRWEQELMSAFLCIALSQPQVLNTSRARLQAQSSFQISRSEHLFFAEWLAKNILPEKLPFFFQGDLRITYRSDLNESLRLSYTFLCRGEPVTVIMGSLAGFDGTFWRGDPPETLTNGQPGGDALLTFLWNPRIHKGPEVGGPLFEFFNQSLESEPGSLDAEEFFLFLADQRGFLQIEPPTPQYAALPIYNIVSEACGYDFRQANGRILMFSTLLSVLVNHACVFTNNVRYPFSEPLTLKLDEVYLQRRNLDDEREIPLLLFRLKNGDPTEQDRFRRIQGTFSKLVGKDRSFDLHVKLQPQPQQSSGVAAAPLPILDVCVTDEAGNISLANQGAGIWEALVLSTLLDESEGRLVLLDEPAANVQAGMQRKLLEVLHAALGQVIVVTHSAYLLPTRVNEFRHVLRTQKTHSETEIFKLGDSPGLTADKLEKKLHASSDIVGLLFADGVILVEGPTEAGAFNEWFPRSTPGQGKTFADMNLVLHGVNGKDDLPFYMRFLTGFGVPWTIICDGDAFPPNRANNCQIWETLNELKLIENVPDADCSFDTLKVYAADGGMFTANTSSTGKFETIPAVEYYLKNLNTQIPPGKSVRRGRVIAENIACPPEIDQVFHKALKKLNGNNEEPLNTVHNQKDRRIEQH